MSGAAGRPIRAVTFDAGGTLIEPWPSVGAVYAEAARDAGFGEFSPSELESRFRGAWRNRGCFDYSRTAWAALVKRAFTGLTSAAGDERLFLAMWNRFAEGAAWRIFPDVAPCLAALRARGISLAVISNWDERLRPLLRNLDLLEAFEFVLPSIEAAAPKPDLRIFHLAANRFSLPREEILHIGDSWLEDWEGARRAGFCALFLDRSATATSADTIAALTDLPERLA
jgi:putative hydrolase of the HAD superfamily